MTINACNELRGMDCGDCEYTMQCAYYNQAGLETAQVEAWCIEASNFISGPMTKESCRFILDHIQQTSSQLFIMSRFNEEWEITENWDRILAEKLRLKYETNKKFNIWSDKELKKVIEWYCYLTE